MARSFALLALALVLGGCGAPGAPSAAKSPDATAEPTTSEAGGEGAEAAGMPMEELTSEDLADVDAAARAFDAAERSLGLTTEPGDAASGETIDRPSAEPPSTQPSPSQTQISPRQGTPLANDACPRACRAFGSMRRSAERLCELTGRDDPRCHNVEERLGRAREAVRRSCPACAS